MKWYTKYLQVYEQPFDSAPKEAVDFVKTKLQKLSESHRCCHKATISNLANAFLHYSR